MRLRLGGRARVRRRRQSSICSRRCLCGLSAAARRRAARGGGSCAHCGDQGEHGHAPRIVKGVKTRISGSNGGLAPCSPWRPPSGLFGALSARSVDVHLVTAGFPSIRSTRARDSMKRPGGVAGTAARGSVEGGCSLGLGASANVALFRLPRVLCCSKAARSQSADRTRQGRRVDRAPAPAVGVDSPARTAEAAAGRSCLHRRARSSAAPPTPSRIRRDSGDAPALAPRGRAQEVDVPTGQSGTPADRARAARTGAAARA
jgi:hypothetical protein